MRLRASGASGSKLNTLKLDGSLRLQDIGLDREQLRYSYGLLNDFSKLGAGGIEAGAGLGTMLATEGIHGGGSLLSGLSQIGGGVASLASRKDFYNLYKNEFRQSRRNEILDYIITNNVVAPTVAFPFNSDVIRDFHGNNVLAYRYYYSADDVQRIDKLLTMFGYKHCKALETSDFNNRQYFNFIKCSNISVTGNARYINDGIADQLNGGVRIWHVKPNKTYYNNNPIRNNS